MASPSQASSIGSQKWPSMTPPSGSIPEQGEERRRVRRQNCIARALVRSARPQKKCPRMYSLTRKRHRCVARNGMALQRGCSESPPVWRDRNMRLFDLALFGRRCGQEKPRRRGGVRSSGPPAAQRAQRSRDAEPQPAEEAC